MLQLPAGWPVLFSFEWWSQFGTGLLSFAAAVVVGSATVAVAWRSHRLANKVAEEAGLRASADAEDRYRDQLIRAVEPAIGSLVKYGALAGSNFLSAVDVEGAARSDALSRLLLVDAIAKDDDKRMTTEIFRAFEASEFSKWNRARVMVAGRLAGSLAAVIGRQHDPDVLIADVRGALAEEEQVALKAQQARVQAERDRVKERRRREAEQDAAWGAGNTD
ncbi:hypothetical protein ACIPEQ_03945 [Curtobacterium sp. NPDC087080]|uniref:hypothetical protein n=1 Tax=Curtobacterium sp. NPDC087080 TaxID=3363965 RepID=UPI00382FA356